VSKTAAEGRVERGGGGNPGPPHAVAKTPGRQSAAHTEPGGGCCITTTMHASSAPRSTPPNSAMGLCRGWGEGGVGGGREGVAPYRRSSCRGPSQVVSRATSDECDESYMH
jgi:hypothetical protein